MIRTYIKKRYNNVVEFVSGKFEEQFKDLYDVDIEKWQFTSSDIDVITNILDKLDKEFVVEYDNSNTGSIIVYELTPIGVLSV